jgi:hypothetical protein
LHFDFSSTFRTGHFGASSIRLTRKYAIRNPAAGARQSGVANTPRRHRALVRLSGNETRIASTETDAFSTWQQQQLGDAKDAVDNAETAAGADRHFAARADDDWCLSLSHENAQQKRFRCEFEHSGEFSTSLAL